MAARKRKRIKVIYRHSSPLLKCVLLTAIVFSTVALLVLKNAIKRKEMEYDDLRKQASQEEHRRTELEEYLENRGTVDGIRQYAEEVLGLVYPGTVFYETTP